MQDFEKVIESSRLKAERLFFPPFTGPVNESTPLNASPYLANLRDLRDGTFLSARRILVDKFIAAIEQLSDYAVTPIAALLGGSAIGPKPQPKDLDCIVFYESTGGAPLRSDGLQMFQKRWKLCGVDIRVIPADSDPILLIKTVSFFTTLYSESRGELMAARGLVLIDCRAPTLKCSPANVRPDSETPTT
jgi:hypothetical protein